MSEYVVIRRKDLRELLLSVWHIPPNWFNLIRFKERIVEGTIQDLEEKAKVKT